MEDRSLRDTAMRHLTLVWKLCGSRSKGILRSKTVEDGRVDYIEHDVRACSNEDGVLFGNRCGEREQDRGRIAKRLDS